MPTKTLSYRAREIEAWVEANMVDSNGIVYTFVDRITGKPIANDIVEAIDPIRLKVGTTEGWWAYENCTMVTAAYMQAMLYRYEVEGDISALARARRCFDALRYIYERGKELEEGFMPKIYGDQFTLETSSDQILFATVALDHYHRHADDAEKAEASRMITEIVRFFVKREYKYTYFGLKDMQWPLARFTCETLMAYKHSGEELFKNEYDRLLALGVNEYPGEEQIRPKLAGKMKPSRLEQEEGGWLLTYPTNLAQMDLTELDYLLRNDPGNKWATRWKRSIIQMWNEGMNMISADGRAYSFMIMDFETNEIRTLDSRFLPRDADRPKSESFGEPDTDAWSFFPFMTYVHSSKGSVSTLYARAGIQVATHFPREITIRPLARRIIQSFDLYDLTYFDEPERFDPRFKYMTNQISGDSVTHWLWGYWQGRERNIFSESE